MRKEIEGRPLLLACVAVLCGFLVKELPISVVAAVAVLFWLRQRRSTSVFLCGAVVGFAIYPLNSYSEVDKNRFFNGNLSITSIPLPMGNIQTCEVSDGQSRYLMRYNKGLELCLGDRIEAIGVIEPPNESSESIYRSNRWSGVLKAAPGRICVLSKGPYVWQLASRWRNSFLGWSRQVLGPSANVSAEALCFNVTTNLTPEYKDSLQRTGTIHIISASGMHVMVVSVFLQFCLSALPIPRLARIGVLSAILLVYAAAAGLEPPVVRSAAMCAVMMLAYAFKREADLLSSLALVCLAYLLLDPASISQIGFQLSFLCVASLGLLSFPELSAATGIRYKVLEYLKYTLTASALVSAATAPVVAYHFGMVSLIGPIANLAIVWVLGPIVIATLASSLTISWAAPVSAGLLVVVAMPLAKWIELSVTWMAKLPFASVNVPAFSAWWLLPIYMLLGICWKRNARKA